MTSRVFSSEAEVLELYRSDKDNNQIVIFEGVVYDVKGYMPEHPGGGELIEEHLGKNIEEQFEEAEHTKTALKLLRALPQIGVIDATKTKSEPSEKLAAPKPVENSQHLEKCEQTQEIITVGYRVRDLIKSPV